MKGEEVADVGQLKIQALGILGKAQDIAVANKADADGAMTVVAEIKTRRAKWVAYWKDIKESAYASWKGIVANEKEGLDIYDKCEQVIKSKVLTWQQAERAKAEAEQRRLQAEADAKARTERERLEAQAAKLKSPEKKAERLEQAAAVVAPTVVVAAPKVEAAGTSVRTTWKAECVDMAVLIAAATPSSVAVSFLEFNQNAADSFARSTKGAVPVAGVKFVAVESLSSRSK